MHTGYSNYHNRYFEKDLIKFHLMHCKLQP